MSIENPFQGWFDLWGNDSEYPQVTNNRTQVIKLTFSGFNESGIATLSNGALLTNPNWTIKGENK